MVYSNPGKVSKPAKQRHIFYVHHNTVNQRNFMDICNSSNSQHHSLSSPIQENWQHSTEGKKKTRVKTASPKKKQYSFSLSPEPRYASSQLGGLLAQKMTKGSCACLHAWFRVIKVLRHTGAKCPVWSLLSSKLYVHKYALPLPSDPASVTLTCDSTLQIAKQD